MTQRELIYIKTVADEKSISQAAKKLFIAQPSLSQYIKRIEDGLGTPLFNRTPAGLTLTYAGERYYLMATQILKMYENFEMEISDINNMKTGRIHLGITSYLGTVLLPKILPRFAELCPSVELHICEETSSRLERLLMAGKLDFVIMHAPKEPDNPLLEYEQLSRDPFLAVTSQKRPLNRSHGGTLAQLSRPADNALIANHGLPEKAASSQTVYEPPVLEREFLEREQLIMLPPGQRIRQISDSILKEAGIHSPDIYLTVKNFSTAQLLAASGLGVTFIPRQYAGIISMEPEPVYYSFPESYRAFWHLCITTAKDSFLSKADLLFLRLLRETIKDTV